MALRTPKVTLLCVGNNEDPCEGGVKDDSSEETRLYASRFDSSCRPRCSTMAHRYMCCLTRQGESRWRTG